MSSPNKNGHIVRHGRDSMAPLPQGDRALFMRPSSPLVRLVLDSTHTMRGTNDNSTGFYFSSPDESHRRLLPRCLKIFSGRPAEESDVFTTKTHGLCERCEGPNITQHPSQHPRRNHPSLYVVFAVRFSARRLNVDTVKHYEIRHYTVWVRSLRRPVLGICSGSLNGAGERRPPRAFEVMQIHSSGSLETRPSRGPAGRNVS